MKSPANPQRLRRHPDFQDMLEAAGSYRVPDDVLQRIEARVRQALISPPERRRFGLPAFRLAPVAVSLVLLISTGVLAFVYRHEIARWVESTFGTREPEEAPEVLPPVTPPDQPEPAERPEVSGAPEPAKPPEKKPEPKKPRPKKPKPPKKEHKVAQLEQAVPAKPPPEPVEPSSDELAEQVRLYRQAEQLTEQKSYPQALHKLEELDRRFPDGPLMVDARISRAEILYRLGRNREAIGICRQLLSLSRLTGKKSQVYLLLGELWRREGDCQQALTAYRRALGLGLGDRQAEAARQGIRACTSP